MKYLGFALIYIVATTTAFDMLHFQGEDIHWMQFDPSGKKYAFTPVGVSWQEAWHFCRNRNSFLISISSAEEEKNLTTHLVEKYGDEVRYWSSGNNFGSMYDPKDSNVYVWLPSGDPLNTLQWCSSEPDNVNCENCVQFLVKEKCWRSIECTHRFEPMTYTFGICQRCPVVTIEEKLGSKFSGKVTPIQDDKKML